MSAFPAKLVQASRSLASTASALLLPPFSAIQAQISAKSRRAGAASTNRLRSGTPLRGSLQEFFAFSSDVGHELVRPFVHLAARDGFVGLGDHRP